MHPLPFSNFLSSFKEVYRGQVIYPEAQHERHSRSRTAALLACSFTVTSNLNLFLNDSIQMLIKMFQMVFLLLSAR